MYKYNLYNRKKFKNVKNIDFVFEFIKGAAFMKKFRKILFSFIMSFALVFSAGAVVFSKFDNQTAFAAANGGSVYVGNNSTNILEGRKSICGFDATNGGGVYIANGGTFKMTGGDIFSNKASMGGGVYVLTGGTFNLSGGSISQNQATGKNVDGITHGGGVYSAGTFNMSGGSIVENKNNGIYVSSGVTTISGGTIAGNGENAIYVGGGTLKVKGGTIVGNIEGKASSVAISGGEIRGDVSTNSVTGGTIYGTVKTNVALSIGGNATILSNGTYAVLSSNGDIIIDKAKIIGDVKAESGNIHIYKDSDITGKIIISNSSKTIYLDNWTTDFVPTYTLDFSSLTSVDETKAYFVFANTMGTQADTSKMTIVAPDGYKAVSKMVNGTNGIYFEVEKVDFPSNWRTQINSSTYMTTTVAPTNITSLRFVSAVPSGFNQIGTFTTGLKVYKNANDIAFVGKNIMAPANSSSLFSGMSKLTTGDFSQFKTGNVTNMNSMFSTCPKLTSIDVSGFNTANVKDMGYMFWQCSSLTSLDLSGFNTSNVTTMWRMFEYCSKLTSIDVSGFNTSKVTTIWRMFYACSTLTSLDLSSFDTSQVTSMSFMFDDCSSLISLNLSNFNTSKVTDMSYMFDGCKALTSLDISSFNMSNVTNFSSMLSFGRSPAIRMIKTPYNNSQEIDIGDGFVFDVEETGGFAASVLANSSRSYTYTLSKYLPSDWKTQVASTTYMTTTVTPASLTSIKFVSSVPSGYTKIGTLSTGLPVYKGTTATAIAFVLSKKISAPVDSANLFFNLKEITSFDFSNFDTSVVKDMSSMFRLCNKLTSLDVSKFNTAKVTNMSYMFNCSLLSSITFGNGFSFNEVTDLSYMFENCPLASINLSPYLNSSTNYKFFTMESMFSGCSALTTITLGTFNAPVLDSTSSMFYGCSNLTSINMKILKTNYLRTTAGMFSSCSSLTSLDLSGFVTKNVITMDNMFESCSSLASITWDESFDTTNVCDMSCMFYNCSALTSLNLKNFDTQNVVSFSDMFNGCGSLRTIFNMNFLTINAINFDNMFYSCSSLLFLDLSSFNMKNAQSFACFLTIDSGDLKYLCTPRFFNYTNYSDGFGGAESLQSANGKSLSDLSSTLSYSEAYVADASNLEQITISSVTVDGSIDSCFNGILSDVGSFHVYNGLFNKYMFPLEYGNFEDYDFTYGDDFKAKLTARTIEFAWFEFGIVTGQMGYYSSADGLEDLYIHVLDGSGNFEMNYSNPGVAVDVVLILNSADSSFDPYGEYSLYYQNLTWGLSANDSFGDEVVISNSNRISKTFTNLTFEKLLYCLPSYPIFDVGNMFFKCWRIGFPGKAETDNFYSNNWVLSWENLANLPDISSVISDMENASGFSNTIFVYPEFVSYDTVFADASASSDATNTAINTNGGGEDVMNGLFSLDLSLYGNEKCILPDNKKTTGVVTEENKVS